MKFAPFTWQTTLTEACGAEPTVLCDLVFDVTGNDRLARLSDVLARPLTALVILLVAWILNRIVQRLLGRAIDSLIARHDAEAAVQAAAVEERATTEERVTMQQWAITRALAVRDASERRSQRTRTLGQVAKSVTSIVIYVIAGLMALGEFDIDIGPLIAGAGIVGVALGFGAQSLVKDFLSGIFMLIEDQYGVGDIVDVGEASGVVEAFNLRTTQIRDINGSLWHVPNGEIARVANKSQEWARTVLDIEVAYDTDLAKAKQVIKRVADQVWVEAPDNATILEEPEVWGLEAFGASAIVIRLAMKVEPAEQWATARVVRARLKEAFEAEGIEIPFPQRTVWMHQVGEAD